MPLTRKDLGRNALTPSSISILFSFYLLLTSAAPAMMQGSFLCLLITCFHAPYLVNPASRSAMAASITVSKLQGKVLFVLYFICAGVFASDTDISLIHGVVGKKGKKKKKKCAKEKGHKHSQLCGCVDVVNAIEIVDDSGQISPASAKQMSPPEIEEQIIQIMGQTEIMKQISPTEERILPREADAAVPREAATTRQIETNATRQIETDATRQIETDATGQIEATKPNKKRPRLEDRQRESKRSDEERKADMEHVFEAAKDMKKPVAVRDAIRALKPSESKDLIIKFATKFYRDKEKLGVYYRELVAQFGFELGADRKKIASAT